MKKNIKIKQQDSTDCGAACLASVFAFHKRPVGLAKIRLQAATDKNGTNIAGLLKACKNFSFQARAVKASLRDLNEIPLPAIVHVVLPSGFHHYMVLYNVKGQSLYIMDPADGEIHRQDAMMFNKIWSGALVLILPEETINKTEEPVSVFSRFWDLIKPEKKGFLLIIIGAILYTLLGLISSVYVQKLVDQLLNGGHKKILNLFGICLLLSIGFQFFIGVFRSRVALGIAQKIDTNLMLSYYRHLLKLPQQFFDTMQTGEIISRLNDAVKIRYFINETLTMLIVNLLIVIMTIIVMFLYHVKLSFIALTVIPFFGGIYWVMNKINKKDHRKIMEESAVLESQIISSIQSATVIKQFSLYDYFNEKTEFKFFRLTKTIYKNGMANIYLSAATEMLAKAAILVVLWAGSYYYLRSTISMGTLIAFQSLILYYTGPVIALISSSRNIQEAFIAGDRLFSIMELQKEPSPVPDQPVIKPLDGSIVFNDVSFDYGTRGKALCNVSFSIVDRSITGIVGTSGSGKSTIAALLQKLYVVETGQIYVGGVLIQKLGLDDLRKHVGVVAQHTQLLAGSILENITIGDPYPNMPFVYQIISRLGMDEFVKSMPNGLSTVLTDNGANLSGGQRQRIAIARALYRKPRILVLDEATAALDADNEQKVFNGLKQYGEEGNTIIVIAHRQSAVRYCEKLLVFEGGKLVNQEAVLVD